VIGGHNLRKAWVRRYRTIVLGMLWAVSRAQKFGDVDESAPRWAGVFTTPPPDSETAAGNVPNRRAWEYIKANRPEWYHLYCMMAHLDRLFSG
jgi:hypothetical protein